MRYLLCSKLVKEKASQCQKLQNQVKPAPKIHFVDFKKIEEEKHKKNGISNSQVKRDERSQFLIKKE
jgi:hypothetical protein